MLRLVAVGYSNPDIARRLVISRRTAEHHVQHIYAKLGVRSRAALALFAMEHDLVGAVRGEIGRPADAAAPGCSMLVHGMDEATFLGSAGTGIGLVAALSLLVQARRLSRLGSACEVSIPVRVLALAGYAVWLGVRHRDRRRAADPRRPRRCRGRGLGAARHGLASPPHRLPDLARL